MIGCELIAKSQIDAGFSNSADQDSTPSTQVYLLTHQIVGAHVVPSSPIAASFLYGADQDSTAGMQIYSFMYQIASRGSIPGESVNSFSSEQSSMVRQQILPFTQQINDDSSNSDLSQDIIAIVQ
jgi:hypothetical protein